MCYCCFLMRKKSTSVNLLPSELPAVEHLLNETLDEGSNFRKECNYTAGFPSPTLFWENGNTFEGNPLIITNIKRSQGGEYRCIANNTCGMESATMFIDVQCKNVDIHIYISFCCLYSQGIVMLTIRSCSFLIP